MIHATHTFFLHLCHGRAISPLVVYRLLRCNLLHGILFAIPIPHDLDGSLGHLRGSFRTLSCALLLYRHSLFHLHIAIAACVCVCTGLALDAGCCGRLCRFRLLANPCLRNSLDLYRVGGIIVGCGGWRRLCRGLHRTEATHTDQTATQYHTSRNP